jgi:ubiquinone/menaquinone biosynthesis C-methylase UbiE
MSVYKKFAEIYDTMGADRFSANMTEYTFRIFNHFHINVKEGLELCCGTGTAMKLFHENGFKMTGLDGSAEMLRVASKKLRKNHINS